MNNIEFNVVVLKVYTEHITMYGDWWFYSKFNCNSDYYQYKGEVLAIETDLEQDTWYKINSPTIGLRIEANNKKYIIIGVNLNT